MLSHYDSDPIHRITLLTNKATLILLKCIEE